SGGPPAAARRVAARAARARRRAGAVRLAAGGTQGVAVRAAAEDARAGVGEAPRQTVAKYPPMTSITRSVSFALANILHPRMIWLMIWPLVIALGIWGTLAIVFWAQIALALAEWLQSGLAYAPFIGDWDFTTATLFLAKVL